MLNVINDYFKNTNKTLELFFNRFFKKDRISCKTELTEKDLSNLSILTIARILMKIFIIKYIQNLKNQKKNLEIHPYKSHYWYTFTDLFTKIGTLIKEIEINAEAIVATNLRSSWKQTIFTVNKEESSQFYKYLTNLIHLSKTGQGLHIKTRHLKGKQINYADTKNLKENIFWTTAQIKMIRCLTPIVYYVINARTFTF